MNWKVTLMTITPSCLSYALLIAGMNYLCTIVCTAFTILVYIYNR